MSGINLTIEQMTRLPGTHPRRDPPRFRGSWTTLVVDKIIPSMVARGFSGLLLDTLDTPPYLEQRDPHGNLGMSRAAVELVSAIRRSYPDLLLIVNRGYALLPNIVECIDAVVAEGLLTSPDSRERSNLYRWNPPSDIAAQLALLRPAVQRPLHVPVLSLDYWCPDDSATIREIYGRERLLGHYPYVATRALDKIIPEP
jgi:hypothetical protein